MNSERVMNIVINATVWGNKVAEVRLMFSINPRTQLESKSHFHLPKRAFANNKPNPAIRRDEETEYCRRDENAS